MRGDRRDRSARFGRLLRGHRVAAGLTQEILAERSGLSVEAISTLERGFRQHPRKDTVRMLSQAMRLAPVDEEALTAAARRAPSPRARPDEVGSIPRPHQPLVGRECEMEAAASLILRPDVRMVTLTGPPGVGKTWLALAVAAQVSAEFPDGLFFVDMSRLAGPELVVSAICRQLEVREAAHRTLEEVLARHLTDRRLLLLLDNFEHVLPAAPAVSRMLANSDSVHVLTTSRAPLHVLWEHQIVVRPLAVEAATTLFVQRVCAGGAQCGSDQEEQEAIARICRRLDCLPLALILAAPWLRIMAPHDLFDRLEPRLPMLGRGGGDLPARQRTMLAALEWSYELLSEEERTFLRRAAVFAHGATFDDLAAVCASGARDDHVLSVVASLVDKNLLYRSTAGGATRIEMLETVREFGREMLRTSGELDGVARLHAERCARLGRQG